eukprot:jgi/Mesvir1/23386/Mv21081-RA.1
MQELFDKYEGKGAPRSNKNAGAGGSNQDNTVHSLSSSDGDEEDDNDQSSVDYDDIAKFDNVKMEGDIMMVHVTFVDNSKAWLPLEKIDIGYNEKMQYFLNTTFRGTLMSGANWQDITQAQKVTAKIARENWNAHVEMGQHDDDQQESSSDDEDVDVGNDDPVPSFVPPPVIAAPIVASAPAFVAAAPVLAVNENLGGARQPAKRLKVDAPQASGKTPSPKNKTPAKTSATAAAAKTSPPVTKPAQVAAPAAPVPVQHVSWEERVKNHMATTRPDTTEEEVAKMIELYKANARK